MAVLRLAVDRNGRQTRLQTGCSHKLRQKGGRGISTKKEGRLAFPKKRFRIYSELPITQQAAPCMTQCDKGE
jgi:hypothetical protein